MGPQLGVAGVLVSRPSDGLIGETDTVPAALDQQPAAIDGILHRLIRLSAFEGPASVRHC